MASQTADMIVRRWSDGTLSKGEVIMYLLDVDPGEADEVIAVLPDVPLRLLREELDSYPNTIEDWAAMRLVSMHRLEDRWEEERVNSEEQRRRCRVVLAYRDAFMRRLQKLRESDTDESAQYRNSLFGSVSDESKP